MGGVVSSVASSTKEIEPDVSDPPHTSPEVIPIAKTPSFHSMPSNVKVSGKKIPQKARTFLFKENLQNVVNVHSFTIR